ncbi:MAG: TolC family protein [Spirochaetaceae bacterium]|nr:TolC family protein [Spirochaetaceae bacterium]
MRHTTRAVLAALLLAATAAGAASADGAPGALDLATARALALAGSASVRKAELAVESASLAYSARVYDGLPSLGASASGSAGYDYAAAGASGPDASLRVSVAQTVLDGGKGASQRGQAAVALEAAEAALRAARVEAIGEADDAFYAALKAAASAEAAAADLAAARLRLEIASAKAAAGVLARSDYLMAESEAAGYETTLIKARKAAASASARLASMTGLPASTTLVPVDFSAYDGLLERLSTLDDDGGLVASLTSAAAEANPGLAGYALSARKAELAVAEAMAGYAPTVTLGLSQGVDWEAGGGFGVGDLSLSLSASMDLGFWATANGVAAAAVSSRSAAVDGADAARALALDVEVAVNDLLAAAGTIASSSTALEYAESSYESALERFRLSAASASDLSSAEALVSSGRTALIGARYDFLSCLTTLRGLVGVEDDGAILAALP